MTVDDERMLLWVLRGDLGLTGTKLVAAPPCAEPVRSSWTMNPCGPVPSRSRTLPAKQVLTIEGLAQDGKLHPLQDAFIKHHAFQCGFCTPGMILNAYTLLLKQPRPARDEIVRHMDDNLCRCGSHNRIVEAIEEAAAGTRGGVR